MFVKHLNGLLEKTTFAFNCFDSFILCLILRKWIIDKVERIIVNEL